MLNRKSILFIFLALLALAVFLIWSAVLSSRSSKALEVIFFDIGQGDAVLIKDSAGNKILVDGGPGDEVLAKLAGETPNFSKKINLVILTHPDSDHLNGALEALKNYQVAGVLESCVQDDLSAYQQWQEIISAKNIERVCARFGQSLKLAGGAKIEVLYPFLNLQGQKFSDTNDASLVLRLSYGENCFLLTGDAPQKTEKTLISSGLDLDCDILQVGHHGSKTSTSQKFFEAVSPEIGIISVGEDNRYGHPHQEVLDRLTGIKIYRTDEEGDIRFECDSEKCLVSD